MSRPLLVACLLPIWILSVRDVRCQIITGDLIGTVADESGGVLPGASVRLGSSALIGGPAERVTNDKGQFRFLGLAPGAYDLEVSLSGFASHREQGLRVEVGRSLERRIALKLGGVAEAVLVTGKTPLVDTRKSGFSTNYGSEYIETVPTRRFSTFDFIKSAPGVSAYSPSGGVSSVSVFGSGVNENAFLIDGTNFT